jgi:CHASE3 domain sensor protein
VSSTAVKAIVLKGEAREVALAEAQTVLSMAQNDEMRARLAELVSVVDDGEVSEGSIELLESVLELGLQTGRVRAYYGPGGEQAAVSTLRRLPKGRERSESARDVTKALEALNGQQIDAVKIAAVSPGAFTITIEAGGVEASVRLDKNGARLTSLAT